MDEGADADEAWAAGAIDALSTHERYQYEVTVRGQDGEGGSTRSSIYGIVQTGAGVRPERPSRPRAPARRT
jgi:hypothetical protein